MNKTIIIIVIITVVLLGGYFLFRASNQLAPQTTLPSNQQTTPQLSTQQPVQTPVAFLPDATSSAQSISTVPSNGDENPYGVAFVPAGFPSGGKLNPGDVLVSNWNDKKIQGAGTTIVKITPTGRQSLFFQGKKGLGLTTALAVLKSGFVIVGNLPTTDGTGATAKAGSLLVLNSKGILITTLTDPNLINGPWDMAVNDNEDTVQAFVSNVLSGSVVRFDLAFSSTGLTSHKGTIIASGYAFHNDPNAAVVGPTGLFYSIKSDTLLVSSTVDNAIFSIANAGRVTASQGLGTVVYKDDQHLRGPLAITQAPNGNLLVTNGDAINPDKTQPSEVVEFTAAGTFVKELSLDSGQGGAFGLAIDTSLGMTRFAAVNDNTSGLLIWTMSAPTDASKTSTPPVSNTPNTLPAANVTVSIKNFSFNPSSLTVKTGTKVTWVNNDTVPHTVTSDLGVLLKSPTLSPGQSFSFMFANAGSFGYHCSIHPMMKGMIVVEK